MILDPTTDRDCLGQLTHMARELAPTTLIQMVARRLGSPRDVLRWLQSLPQSDDDGAEPYRYVACDVSQRVRLLPDDPNCFERAFAALALLEVLDPRAERMLVTIDRPVRHTGVVERRGGRWEALDLFPRRNFDWGEFGKDALQGFTRYVGKPVLKFYLGDTGEKVGSVISDQEDRLIGREKKPAPVARPPPRAPAGAPPVARPPAVAVAVAPARIVQPGKGGENGEERKTAFQDAPGGARSPVVGGGDDDAPTATALASQETKRWGWG